MANTTFWAFKKGILKTERVEKLRTSPYNYISTADEGAPAGAWGKLVYIDTYGATITIEPIYPSHGTITINANSIIEEYLVQQV